MKEHLWRRRKCHWSRHTPTLLQQCLEARWWNTFVYKLRFCWIVYSWCFIKISWNKHFNNLKTLGTIAVSMESARFVYAIVASILVLTHESEIHDRVWKCSFKGSALFECFPPATLQYPLSVSVLEISLWNALLGGVIFVVNSSAAVTSTTKGFTVSIGDEMVAPIIIINLLPLE